jgi:hypothetical protein
MIIAHAKTITELHHSADGAPSDMTAASTIQKDFTKQTINCNAACSSHLLHLLHGEAVRLVNVASAVAQGQYYSTQLQQLLSSILSHIAASRNQAALALQTSP